MDKIIHYSIIDMLSQNNEISVSIRITTKGFPVEEKYESYLRYNGSI